MAGRGAEKRKWPSKMQACDGHNDSGVDFSIGTPVWDIGTGGSGAVGVSVFADVVVEGAGWMDKVG